MIAVEGTVEHSRKCCMEGLPNELREEIFVLVVFSNETDRRAKVAMRLAHVNHQWRSFVMGAPNFWTHITISTMCDADVLRQIFELHAHKPLDISVEYPVLISPNASLRFWKIMLAVAGQIGNCRQLRIRTTGSNYQLIHRAFLNPSHAPRLEYLELIRTDNDPSISASFPSVEFDPAVLSRVHISGVLWNSARHAPGGVHQLHFRGTDAAWQGAPRGMNLPGLAISYTPIGWSTVLQLDTSALIALKIEGDQSILFFPPLIAFKTLQSLEVASLSKYVWTSLIRQFQSSLGKFGAVKQLTLSHIPCEAELIDVQFLDAFPALEHLAFVAPSGQPTTEFLDYYGRLTRRVPKVTFNDVDVQQLLRDSGRL